MLSTDCWISPAESGSTDAFLIGWRTNPVIFLMILLVAALQLAVLYVPGLAAAFGVVSLWAEQLAICTGLGVVPLAVIEMEKWIRRRAI